MRNRTYSVAEQLGEAVGLVFNGYALYTLLKIIGYLVVAFFFLTGNWNMFLYLFGATVFGGGLGLIITYIITRPIRWIFGTGDTGDNWFMPIGYIIGWVWLFVFLYTK